MVWSKPSYLVYLVYAAEERRRIYLYWLKFILKSFLDHAKFLTVQVEKARLGCVPALQCHKLGPTFLLADVLGNSTF